MAIRSRKGKKGTTYQVIIEYKDMNNEKQVYYKGGFTSRKEAVKHEAEIRLQIERERHVIEICEKTFNEVFDEYMELEKENYANTTYNNYQDAFRLYIKNSIGKRRIATLRPIEVQKYIDTLNRGKSTAKNVFKVLRVTFKHAVINGYIDRDPSEYVSLAKVKPNETEGKEKIAITFDQLETLVEEMLKVKKHTRNRNLDAYSFRVYAIALYAGWFLGLRVSEVFGLKKEDFDFENDIVHIRRRLEYSRKKKSQVYLTEKMKTKNSKADLVLHPKFKEIMQEWFKENPYEYVICDIEGNLMHPGRYTIRLREISKRLNLKVSSHIMRHSMLTNLTLNDTNPVVLKALARHSDVKTSYNIYSHATMDDMKKAVESAIKINIDKVNHGIHFESGE